MLRFTLSPQSICLLARPLQKALRQTFVRERSRAICPVFQAAPGSPLRAIVLLGQALGRRLRIELFPSSLSSSSLQGFPRFPAGDFLVAAFLQRTPTPSWPHTASV